MTAGAEETVADGGGSDPGGQSTVLAVIRTPNPKDLAAKLVEVARKIQPGPQTEGMPFILGGMLGDPTLESISATDNVGVALIESGGNIRPVLIMKLTEASPLRQSLPAFEMSLRDFNDWTFALPEGTSASLVEGAESKLIAAVQSPRRYDLELTADGPGLAQKLREANSAIPEMTGFVASLVRPVLEGLAAEADTLRDFRFGLNISADQIEQVYYLQAAENSPLAAFFNQTRPENLDFARFIRADEAVAYLGGFDIAATRSYFDHFFNRVSQGSEGEGKEFWEMMHRLGTRFFESTDGRSGGVMSMEGAKVAVSSIMPSNLNNQQLMAMLSGTTEAMSGMLRRGLGEEEIGPEYAFLPAQLEVEGVPVHILRTEFNLDLDPATGDDAEASLAQQFQNQDMHYAVVDGYILNTADADRMGALIRAVQKGEAVENNLQAAVQVAEEDLFAFRVDLVRYFGGVMAGLSPEYAPVIRELEARGLKPLTGTAMARGGEAEVRISLPVDTLVAAYEVFSKTMAAEEESAAPVPAPAVP